MVIPAAATSPPGTVSLKGIVTYDWSSDGKSILVPLEGVLYLAGVDGTVKVVKGIGKGEMLNSVLSETGKYLSFVRDNRLWVGTLDGQPELPIGEPGLDPVAPGCVAPDGSAVAVPVSGSGDAPDALLLVPTDGSPATRVASGSVDLYGPACSWKARRCGSISAMARIPSPARRTS